MLMECLCILFFLSLLFFSPKYCICALAIVDSFTLNAPVITLLILLLFFLHFIPVVFSSPSPCLSVCLSSLQLVVFRLRLEILKRSVERKKEKEKRRKKEEKKKRE